MNYSCLTSFYTALYYSYVKSLCRVKLHFVFGSIFIMYNIHVCIHWYIQDIEEDMVPDDMKKRLKSLEDKLTQQKLRQSIISSFIEQTNPPVHSTASSSDELTSSATAPKATAATSNMASSESYVFPKGRFLVLPTIPAQSPPPCVEGGGTGVPPLIHVPSSQSLQGVYTQPTA